MVAVEVKNLVKHFGSTRAVEDISFTVNKGGLGKIDFTCFYKKI